MEQVFPLHLNVSRDSKMSTIKISASSGTGVLEVEFNDKFLMF